MKMRTHFAVFMIWTLGGFSLCGQGTIPEGSFIEETIKVGEPLHYVLRYIHAPEDRLLFPDSSFFLKDSTFEWTETRAFPTRTYANLSTDSVIYTLRTFALDTFQNLQVPVYRITDRGDTQKIYPEPAEVELRYALTSMDTLQRAAQGNIAEYLKTDTRFTKVPLEFNYPYFYIGAVVLLVVAVGLLLIFGKPVRKYFKAQRTKRSYQKFVTDYNQTLAQGADSHTTERALVLWKSYLEKLRDQPYSSFTGKEIARLHPEAELAEPLRDADRAIYGGKVNGQTEKSLEKLREYAKSAFQERLNNLKNA